MDFHHHPAEVPAVMAYWRRRLERRVFLLAMVCSMVFLTGQFTLMTVEDCWVTAVDIAHIFAALLHTLCIVIFIDLMLPSLTRSVKRKTFWLVLLSSIWIYIRVVFLQWQQFSHRSTAILAALLLLPAWPLLWLRAQYKEFFNGLLSQVRRHMLGITDMDVTLLAGRKNDCARMGEWWGGEQKHRVVGLLGLIASGRIILTMLGAVGLGEADLVKLKNCHIRFCEKVVEARTVFLERQEAALVQRRAFEEMTPRKQSVYRNSLGPVAPDVSQKNFQYDISTLIDAAVVFMAEVLSLLMARLERKIERRLDNFAGEMMQSWISNPKTQRRWRQLMSSTQHVVTKKALDRLESIFVPLPAQIDPTHTVRLLGNLAFIELLQRNFFTSITQYWISNKKYKLYANRTTRTIMWLYILVRFGLHQGRKLIDS